MVKVSVLMPIYNTPEKYLREAIESILNQTYTDFEFIILNDSPSNTNLKQIVKSYKDARIIYYENEQNQGISSSRNKLIDLSTGEYLAVFDHDDISLAHRLQKQVEFLDTHPEVGVVGSWRKILSKKNTISRCATTDREIKEDLMLGCSICHPASMIRKSVLIEHNIGYENEYSPSEDYAMWCRLMSKTNFAAIPEVLFVYRCHVVNTSHLQKKQMRNATLRIQDFARRENPEHWAAVKASTTQRISLFNFLPILTIKSTEDRTLWLLFGFIPLLSIKNKHPRIYI